MEQKDKPTCFVIMPFKVRQYDLEKYFNDADHWNEVYQGLICPAVAGADLHVQRDDEDYSSRLVGAGIWSKIEKADLILCDMSSHNPNVHLELGWAMRADKKIVFIKDDLTEFNFDLNQYYTYQYSHKLQPTILNASVKQLSKIISSTLADTSLNYSIVNKLALQKEAIKATYEGNLEVGLLQELISEVRGIKKPNFPSNFSERPTVHLEIENIAELPERLIGTTWRKRDGLEEIFFTSESKFIYTSVGIQKWIENDVSFDLDAGAMKLRWRHDNFIANCKFNARYSAFVEQDGTQWFLIALKPFIHSSFSL